ncbi:unnamed protein product [Cochlearia groenlandica]
MESAFNELILNDTVSRVANPNPRHIGRIIVSGYDVKLPHDDLKRALSNHFASCGGEITDIYIPLNSDNTLHRYTFMYLWEKAQQKRRCDSLEVTLEDGMLLLRLFLLINMQDVVRGYDTLLSKIELEDMLTKHFSCCGEVEEVKIHERIGAARVSLCGQDAEYKVLQLDGSFTEGRKLRVKLFTEPGFYTVHSRRRYGRISPRHGT